MKKQYYFVSFIYYAEAAHEIIIQESLANAKVSARQPWYIGRNSLNRPPLKLRIAQQYQRNLYIVEKYFQCATIPSLTVRAIFIHLAVVAYHANQSKISRKFELTAVQGHPRSTILVPIVRRLIGWKLRIFHTPLLFGAPALYVPFDFRGEVKRQKTRVMGLLWWKLRDPNFNRLTLTDPPVWRTDRRTDGRAMAYSAL